MQTVELLTCAYDSFKWCGFRKTTNKSKLFFLMQEKQVKKAAETEQARCTTQLRLGSCRFRLTPLGSRIPGTGLMGGVSVMDLEET